jgi:hypothetical protein
MWGRGHSSRPTMCPSQERRCGAGGHPSRPSMCPGRVSTEPRTALAPASPASGELTLETAPVVRSDCVLTLTRPATRSGLAAALLASFGAVSGSAYRVTRSRPAPPTQAPFAAAACSSSSVGPGSFSVLSVHPGHEDSIDGCAAQSRTALAVGLVGNRQPAIVITSVSTTPYILHRSRTPPR